MRSYLHHAVTKARFSEFLQSQHHDEGIEASSYAFPRTSNRNEGIEVRGRFFYFILNATDAFWRLIISLNLPYNLHHAAMVFRNEGFVDCTYDYK